ncbi:ArnT family glycosyltransferase [Acidobacteriota bacterium]
MELKEKKFYGLYREDKFQGFAFLLLLLFSLVMFISVVFRFFGHDEFEHIHSAWYVARGYQPYLDFFQVHHPLLWFLLAPVIAILGESLTTFFVIRFLMAFLTLGSGYILFRLTKLVTGSREVALISAVFLLSTVMFVEKGIQVRPDVPQVFFALLSLHYIVLFFKRKREKKYRYICLSGLFAGISFLFLQKSVFLLLAYGFVFLYRLIKKELSLKSVVLFSLFFLLPNLSLVVYLAAAGTFPEYILTNWLVPGRLLAHFSPHYILFGMWAENLLLWLLLIASMIAICLKMFRPPRRAGKRANREMLMLLFIALVFFICACLMRLPFKQNFMLPMALFCIPASYFFKVLSWKSRWTVKKKRNALAIVTLIPFLILTAMIFLSNRSQVEKIKFVLNHTKGSEEVYDGDIQFNLFRKDLHYFWYGLKKNKEFTTYKKFSGSNIKYADYNIYRLIREKKPAFISDTRLKITKGGLDKLYKKTAFEGLYIRVTQ